MKCELGAARDPSYPANEIAPAIVWCFTHNCHVGAGGCQQARIAELEAAIDKARALLICVAGQGVVKDGQQRMPVGVQAESGGVARYLTASFIKKCADWCEDFPKSTS